MSCAVWLLLPLAPLFAQSFEVADVKPNKSGEIKMSIDIQPGGRFVATNVPLRVLIALANKVRPDALAGGPSWLATERFDVVAKASEKSASQDDIRVMVQTLLKERFGLATHTEERPMAAFALVKGSGAPKLTPSNAALLSGRRCVPGRTESGGRTAECRGLTLAVLGAYLMELAPQEIPVPVVDQTGIEGAYDFRLEWTPAKPDSTGPTIFDAVETQLGLKLQRTKLPLPVIVIDRVERTPREN